jgi:hypothetical protein
MVDGTAPNNGCPPGQDSQSLQLSVTVSGFGIEGVVMSAMRNSPNGCVPSGTSSITKDLCANTASALKTSGCQITFESSDSSDRTPGFIADAGLTLLCRGDRSFLVATADNALSVGFGVTPPK